MSLVENVAAEYAARKSLRWAFVRAADEVLNRLMRLHSLGGRLGIRVGIRASRRGFCDDDERPIYRRLGAHRFSARENAGASLRRAWRSPRLLSLFSGDTRRLATFAPPPAAIPALGAFAEGSVLPSGLESSCDRNRIDVALVHEFVRTSYWAEGRSRDTVERSIRNSLCFGVYSAERQVAFARVFTDRAVFAYLADVFVAPEFRNRGIAKALIRAILAHEDLQTLRTFLLGTRDAHRLYAQFGFGPVPEPRRLMGRYAPQDNDGQATS
jgi:GNAT superfamily N-acetyltransferase